MKQREIWFADLNPTKGSEQSGIRPVVVISGDTMNSYAKLSFICPLSSKIKNYSGTIVLPKTSQNGLTSDSEVLVFQMRVITKDRFLNKIGKITEAQLEEIIEELNGLFELE